MVITDEIYEHLVYGDAEHRSILALVPELADQCIVLNGVAKTYAMTGWRWDGSSPPRTWRAATSLQSHMTSNVNNVAQVAALAAVSGDLSAVEEMRAVFDQRRRTIHRALNGIEGVTCWNRRGLLRLPEPHRAPRTDPRRSECLEHGGACADLVLEEANVAFVPGEAFGTPKCALLVRDGHRRHGRGRRAHPQARRGWMTGPGAGSPPAAQVPYGHWPSPLGSACSGRGPLRRVSLSRDRDGDPLLWWSAMESGANRIWCGAPGPNRGVGAVESAGAG
ncbi:MAG: aminotransferase class I/II-fold pyridoxal phosphate-dependent enzyme [Microthrixaceae bacterium]